MNLKPILALAAAIAAYAYCPKTVRPVYLDPSKPLEERVEDALSRMTMEEKVAMTHAQSKFSSAGAEVVQLYVSDTEASVERPVKELKGFEKVYLEPGQSRKVEFTLDRQALSFFDADKHAWVAEPGEFHALLGTSSEDIKADLTFTL